MSSAAVSELIELSALDKLRSIEQAVWTRDELVRRFSDEVIALSRPLAELARGVFQRGEADNHLVWLAVSSAHQYAVRRLLELQSKPQHPDRMLEIHAIGELECYALGDEGRNANMRHYFDQSLRIKAVPAVLTNGQIYYAVLSEIDQTTLTGRLITQGQWLLSSQQRLPRMADYYRSLGDVCRLTPDGS